MREERNVTRQEKIIQKRIELDKESRENGKQILSQYIGRRKKQKK